MTVCIFFKLLGRDLETRFGRCRYNSGKCTGDLDHLRIADPIRSGNDNLITLVGQHLDNIVNGMLRPAGNSDLIWVVSEVIVALEFGGDRLAEFGSSGTGRVLGLAFFESPDSGLFDGIRG